MEALQWFAKACISIDKRSSCLEIMLSNEPVANSASWLAHGKCYIVKLVAHESASQMPVMADSLISTVFYTIYKLFL